MPLVYPIKCSVSKEEMDFAWLWRRVQKCESSSKFRRKMPRRVIKLNDHCCSCGRQSKLKEGKKLKSLN